MWIMATSRSSPTSWRSSNEAEVVARHSVVSNGGTKITLTTPGLDFDDFYKYGDVSLWKIMKNFSMLRVVSLSRVGFCMNDAMDPEHSFFVVQTDLHVDRKYYETTRAGRMWTALRFTMQLTSIGRSTLNLALRCSVDGSRSDDDVDGGVTLVSGACTLVRVNANSRRSSPFPDSFVQRYSKLILDNNRLNYTIDRKGTLPLTTLQSPSSDVAKLDADRGRGFDVPDVGRRTSSADHDVTDRQFIVRPSDCDLNNHTNNAIYARFCLDRATLSAARCRPIVPMTSRGRSDDVSARPVRRIVARFARESGVDDVVTVSMRPDDRRADTVHFWLTKKNKEKNIDEMVDDKVVLFEMTVEFYDNVTDLFDWQRMNRAKL